MCIRDSGKGISYEGDLIDLATKANIITKTGSWFSFEDSQIGQGREKVKTAIKEDKKLKTKIEKQHEMETKKEEAPWVSPMMTSVPRTPTRSAEKRIEETVVQEKLVERSEAVQAYLDFVESTVIKTGQLIKKGFIKGKGFLFKSLNLKRLS